MSPEYGETSAHWIITHTITTGGMFGDFVFYFMRDNNPFNFAIYFVGDKR